MSTELSNGVIIPEEYSDDWYDEMSINLRKLNDVITAASDNATDIQRLDTDKANQSDLTALTSRVSQNETDITALQTAVSGALKREIVASLPTTDIDPNTIYMILSGTSATENVYNEFMYVNNAWELIGTSATDLTNYYTKGDVDGLLLLKANASDLTSHTGDTTIHVTASDKSKWDTVALIKQLRLANAQVGSATTIAFANIDDTNGIKVGDKCMDLDAKMFEITAVDTTNQTVTVGSALIDLALDANVVHTSGNETINGVKSFINYFLGKDLSGQTVDLNDCVDAYGGAIHYYYAVSNYTNISNKPENKPFILESKTVRYVSSIDYIYYQKIYTANYNASPSIYTRYYRSGSSSWSNWIKDTDKFVTTDTNQTVGGNKTFSSDITLQGTTTPVIKTISNIVQDSTGGNESISWVIRDKTDSNTVFAQSVNKFSGQSVDFRLDVTSILNGTSLTRGIRLVVDPVNESYRFTSSGNNTLDLGSSGNKWKGVNTYLVNGLTPSSMSMPNFSGRVDITSYISNLTGATNTYTPSVNGWLYVGSNDASYLALFDTGSGGSGIRFSDGVVGEKYAFLPCQASRTLGIRITCTNLVVAYFIPCLGNI